MDKPLWQRPVSYAAIGASQAADLLRYPPAGYRAFERKARIGHGDARFEYAWSSALSWGIQRGAGFVVVPVETPDEVSEQTYIPVSFDEEGVPVAPAGDRLDHHFGPDGTPFVRPGDTACLEIPILGRRWVARAPVRVVMVIDEPLRKGFVYGTLAGHPEDGEESFIVTQRDDGSVWLTIRAFSRPSTRWWWSIYPVLRVMEEYYTRRYLRALAVPID